MDFICLGNITLMNNYTYVSKPTLTLSIISYTTSILTVKSITRNSKMKKASLPQIYFLEKMLYEGLKADLFCVLIREIKHLSR